LFVLLTIPLLALGCGKKAVEPETQRRNSELAEIYDSYTMYAKKNQRPPKQVSDLKDYEGINPIGIQALKDGRYVAVWGVSSRDAGTVLAYEKDAPKQGGAVLMASGDIKNMSADELQAALKNK
jgi:hypothetical protein